MAYKNMKANKRHIKELRKRSDDLVNIRRKKKRALKKKIDLPRDIIKTINLKT